MATTDPIEWVLYATDLTTRLAILPAAQSHLYLEFDEPGSGELRIPLDSASAGLVASGQMCVCYYRGAARSAFFVDNIKEVEADAGEGGGRWLSVSGRGLLAILDDAIVWQDGSGSTVRAFVAQKKGSILKTLIDEAKARGALSALTYDFSATVDSTGTAWTDSEDYDINVGMSLLEVLRMFAKTGEIEFDIALQSSTDPIILHAYANGTGTDRSNSVYMRIGSNCEEVTTDERSDELKNVILVKYKSGYAIVSDSGSIAARRRRETHLSLEAAQSSASAVTYASAKLSDDKDPKTGLSVRVYDGVSPYLFVSYALGDTITVDKFGEEVSYRILGIQADWDGDDYARVVLELNTLFYDNELRMKNDLENLLNQWDTAKDGDLTEVSYWAIPGVLSGIPVGSATTQVYAMCQTSTTIYIAGDFLSVNGVSTPGKVAQFNKATGVWSAMSGGPPGDIGINCMVAIGSDVYAVSGSSPSCTIQHWTGSAWVTIGTLAAGDDAYSIATDGVDLWVGGDITLINGSIAIDNDVAKFTIGGTWSSVGTAVPLSACSGLTFFGGDLYGQFGDGAHHFNGSTWGPVCGISGGTFGMTSTIDFIAITLDNKIYSWDGSSTDFVEIGEATGGPDPLLLGVDVYLNDIYVTGSFTGITATNGASANNIAKYSGGTWYALLNGLTPVNLNGWSVSCDDNNGDIWAGGVFTGIDGKLGLGLGVYITDFQSLITHLEQGSYNFNMAGAIHGAPASAVTDNDEFPFWEDTTTALRKITWANIKSTLITLFDTMYLKLTGGTLTDTLGISQGHNGESGLWIETIGDAYPLSVGQYTDTDNVSSPALWVLQETDGTGNITGPGLQIKRYDSTSGGTVTGDLIDLQREDNPVFNVDYLGNITLAEASNLIFGTSTGTKIGTATNQKLGFYNSSPIVQPAGDLIAALGNLGLVSAPIISNGAMYADDITQAVTVSSANVYYEVPASMTGGHCSAAFTFQNSKELKCNIAGWYRVIWGMSITSATNNENISGAVMVNSTEAHSTEGSAQCINSSKPVHVGGAGAVQLAVNDVVKLCVQNEDAAHNITVYHANMSLLRME
jgi:hypothetical protein